MTSSEICMLFNTKYGIPAGYLCLWKAHIYLLFKIAATEKEKKNNKQPPPNEQKPKNPKPKLNNPKPTKQKTITH